MKDQTNKAIIIIFFLFLTGNVFSQDLIVTFYGKTGGEITVGKARCPGALIATFKGDTVPVVSFNVAVCNNYTNEEASYSSYFSLRQRAIMSGAKKGSLLYFSDIKVKLDSSIVKAKSFEFKVIENIE